MSIFWNYSVDDQPRITIADEIDYVGPRKVTHVYFRNIKSWNIPDYQHGIHYIFRYEGGFTLVNPFLVDYIKVIKNSARYVAYARKRGDIELNVNRETGEKLR